LGLGIYEKKKDFSDITQAPSSRLSLIAFGERFVLYYFFSTIPEQTEQTQQTQQTKQTQQTERSVPRQTKELKILEGTQDDTTIS
jgi:hypothetical protein